MPENELEARWKAIRDELRRSSTELTFHLWLEPLEPAAIEHGSVHVRAPGHIRTLVQERYLGLLRAAAERALGNSVVVELVGDDWSPPARGGAARRSAEAGACELLNPRYTFEQFVIGDANRLAHASALTVAEQPGQAYNPLFLHGAPGLGKTHLLHAIGNYVQRYGGGLTVRYATADGFTAAFVDASRARERDRRASFVAAFRNVDVLLIDDVQLLADKTRTQEELFHTFNALYEAGAQLVFSSDRPPAQMGSFERRLSERFGSGLVAEVESPDHEVRMAILRKRARMDGLGVDDDTLAEVARHVDSSIRALEGAFIRVVAYASLKQQQPTPELASQLLEHLYPRPQLKAATVTHVQEQAAVHFGVSTAALRAHSREPRLSLARQIAMYLARELTDESLPGIGKQFERNHSTVLHAHRRIAAARASDIQVDRDITKLEQRLAKDRTDRAK